MNNSSISCFQTYDLKKNLNEFDYLSLSLDT